MTPSKRNSETILSLHTWMAWITILIFFVGMLLNSHLYYLMLLLKEQVVFVLTYSLARNLLFEICSPVHILLILKEMKYDEIYF
jgi:hypothetical protein